MLNIKHTYSNFKILQVILISDCMNNHLIFNELVISWWSFKHDILAY